MFADSPAESKQQQLTTATPPEPPIEDFAGLGLNQQAPEALQAQQILPDLHTHQALSPAQGDLMQPSQTVKPPNCDWPRSTVGGGEPRACIFTLAKNRWKRLAGLPRHPCALPEVAMATS
jgi:hypothetical protein